MDSLGTTGDEQPTKPKSSCKFCGYAPLVWREVQAEVKRPFEFHRLEEKINYKIHDCQGFWKCEYCGVEGLVFKKEVADGRELKIPYKLKLASILYRDGTHEDDNKIHECDGMFKDPEAAPDWESSQVWEEEDIDYFMEDVCEHCGGQGCIECLGDYSYHIDPD